MGTSDHVHLATAILDSWLLNHLLRETHSFHQLGETKIGAQGIDRTMEAVFVGHLGL
jgi:hypothetical protein